MNSTSSARSRIGSTRVLGLGHPEQHVQEIAGVGQIVVRQVVGPTDRMPVGIGGDGRHLRDEADGLQAPRLGREDLLRVRIERGQRPHSADEHAHRMGVVLEPLHQLRDVRVQHRVERDVTRPLPVFCVGRQLAEENHVRGFEKITVLGQLFDWIAAVEEDALVAVDERDAAAAGGGVHERRVVGHHPELVGGDFDLPQIHRANGAVLDRDVVLLARAVVGDGERVGHAVV